ncbi:MAG: GtrA family protein, partial [Clostridia bacterium]|nr:GtrA family protein [Clostridia bacterium]
MKIIALLKRYREVIAYLFWGGMTTLVSWGSYAAFALLLGGLPAAAASAVANVLSWVCAVVFAFVTNKLWVFQSKSWAAAVWLKEFGSFLSARVATGVLEIAGV